ncbi:MAG: TMEM43 family protein [bacterium]|nr:TMEM43 family protein [bacterium]
MQQNLGNKSYRVRKEGGIFSSIIGMMIGLLFVVVASPLTAWYAESQHRAADFTAATVVEADSSEEGYVVVEATATNKQPLVCPVPFNEIDAEMEEENCVYVEEQVERYGVQEKEHCGSLSSNQTVVRQLQDECDADGTNCESCYLVEEYDWETESTDSQYASFLLGKYEITPSDGANFIGTKEFTEYDLLADYEAGLTEDGLYDDVYYDDEVDTTRENTGAYEVGDLRYTYTYLNADQTLLVAGDADNNQIKGAYDKKPYVVSSLNYQGTMEDLEAQDSASKWGLRIASLVLMVLGVVMIFGPLTIFTNVFRFIPWLGKRLDKGLDSMIQFIAALIGFVMWIILYAMVLVLKNIWLIIIVLAVLGVGVFMLVKMGKKKSDAVKSEQPATKSVEEEKPVEKPVATPPEEKKE